MAFSSLASTASSGHLSARCSTKFQAQSHFVLLPPPVVSLNTASSIAVSTTNHKLVRSAIAAAALMDAPSMTSSFSSMMESGDESEQEVVEVDASLQDDSLKIENLGLSEETIAALRTRGINSLFPIQKSVFQPIQGGRDLIGRAKTGSGKTLAFALPVVEGILKENEEAGGKTLRGKGRPPRALVMAPTRELANQVAREFETVCPGLKVVSVYGGVPIGGNLRELERGCDVIVGTPGRIIDLIERDALKLDKIRYAILDEADQMLDMGFEEDMENILGNVPEQRQTLLFSATLPKWVNKVARKFQTNPLLVDLVGEENTGRLADTIKLQVMQVEWTQKLNALMDSITLHAANGKSIIFVNTKVRADEVCDAVGAIHPTVVLHGDISQGMRDRSLQQFRDGKVSVLVATDVAARGLDIPSVDLVLHYDVPLDNESFLHRSGRTGRAGNKGTAVVLFTEKEVRSLGTILRQCKVDNAELVGAPEPRETLGRAAKSVLGQLDKVDSEVIDWFVPAAEKLLSSDQPTRVMAAALAALSGFRAVPKPRSLLTYEEGMVTLRLMASSSVGIDGYRSLVMALRAVLTKSKVRLEFEQSLGKVKPVSDKATRMSGCAFDLPEQDAKKLLGSAEILEAAQKAGYVIDCPKSLPLDPREMMGEGEGRGGGGGRFGRDRGGGGGGYGRSRDDRGGYGGDRGGMRDRRGGGGGRDRFDDRRGGGGGGGDRSYDDRRGGSSRPGGRSSSSRGSSMDDDFFDPSAGAGYFKSGGSGSGAGRSASSSGAGRARAAPSVKDGWAQW